MKRESTIDVLKGIAVLFVVITHFPWSVQERLSYLFPFWIPMAVPVFVIISGYVMAMSFERRQITLRIAYSPGFILSRIISLYIPYLLAFVLLIVFNLLFGKADNPGLSFRNLLLGNIGDGSYYTNFMIGFVLIYPVVYYLVARHKMLGVVLLTIINALFELFFWVINDWELLYRICIIRHLSVLAFGCYFGIGGKIRKTTGLLFIVIGLFFAYFYSYMGYDIFVYPAWKGTSYPVTFVIIGIFYFIRNCQIHFPPLQYIGRISYSIFFHK